MESNTSTPSSSSPSNVPESNQAPAARAGRLEDPTSLLKSSWEFYKAHWRIIIAIMAVPSILMFTGQMFMTGNPFLVLFGILLMIVGGVFSVASQPAVVLAIQKLTGDPGAAISIQEQYKIGFTFFWSLVLLALMQTLVAFGSFVLLIVPGIIMSVYLSLYLFARIIDGKKGFEAFSESYSLVYGRWWPVLGRYALILVIYMILGLVIGFVAGIFSLAFGMPEDGTGEQLVSTVINLLLSIFVGSLITVYIYKLYLNLKATRLPNVPTNYLKSWMIGFMVVGVVAIIGLIMIIGVVAYWLDQSGLILDRNFDFSAINSWKDCESIAPGEGLVWSEEENLCVRNDTAPEAPLIQ